jgi:hypothetical protein
LAFQQKVRGLLAFSFAVDVKHSHIICCVQTLRERIVYGSHSEGVLVDYIQHHRTLLHNFHHFDVFVKTNFKVPSTDEELLGSTAGLDTRHNSGPLETKIINWEQGFFVCHRLVSAVKRVEFVSDRMSYIVLRGRWCNIIVLNVRAPSEEKTDHSKDSFYEEYLPGDFRLARYNTQDRILKGLSHNRCLYTRNN